MRLQGVSPCALELIFCCVLLDFSSCIGPIWAVTFDHYSPFDTLVLSSYDVTLGPILHLSEPSLAIGLNIKKIQISCYAVNPMRLLNLGLQ